MKIIIDTLKIPWYNFIKIRENEFTSPRKEVGRLEMKNIHCKIPKEVHKTLVVHALDRGLNLEDVIKEIVTKASEEIQRNEKGDTEDGR